MTSFCAKTPHQMNVVFIVYPDIVLLDLVGPLQVFTHARRSADEGPAYKTHAVSFAGGSIETNTILPINSDALGDWLGDGSGTPIHTLVIVGGDGALVAVKNAQFVDQVRQLADRCQRVCSVCSGAFVLAAAGLLDGRRAVTHWEDCDTLAAQYPAVNVEVDPIYIKEGTVWTSAGITAGIDMALAIIEEDLGTPAAIELARSLVTPLLRSGGQSQFSPDLDRRARDTEGRFERLHTWIRDHLQETISVEVMADQCGMSPRNFSRQYSATMGTPPARAVEAIRVTAARSLLETTQTGVKSIAVICGFQDDERMRRAFLRHVHTSPSQYRANFQSL